MIQMTNKKQQGSKSTMMTVKDLESTGILLANTPDCPSKAIQFVLA
jgi:hypothetical protein